MDADERGRPPAAAGRERDEHRHRRVLRVHDVRPESPDRAEHAPGSARDAPRAPLEQRQRERLQADLVGDGPGGRGDRDDVSALGRTADERGDDAFGAAGAHLLDHVQDPHRQLFATCS